jgi:hypothetical protein
MLRDLTKRVYAKSGHKDVRSMGQDQVALSPAPIKLRRLAFGTTTSDHVLRVLCFDLFLKDNQEWKTHFGHKRGAYHSPGAGCRRSQICFNAKSSRRMLEEAPIWKQSPLLIEQREYDM